MMFYTDSKASIAGNSSFKMHLVKGFFSCRAPLKHNFRFADDYNKVIRSFTHQLTLKRKSEYNNALFRDDETADGKITLHKLSWFVLQ